MSLDEKRDRIDARSWYHSIEIEPGLVTPGVHSLAVMRQVLDHLDLPASLQGLSVLDIGAWDGFFSFEAERRGARRVVAYDLPPADRFGFATARDLIGSRAEYVEGSVYELSRDEIGTFDVVLFLGVLYHLRYPLLALDRIRDVCDGYVVLEPHFVDNGLLLEDGRMVPLEQIDPRLARIPLYRFYPSDELNGDFSNRFGPNRSAIEEGLRTAGFEPELLSEWGDRIAYRGTRVCGTPEYRQQTYDGLRFTRDAEGVLRDVSVVRTTPGRRRGIDPGPELARTGASSWRQRLGRYLRGVRQVTSTPPRQTLDRRGPPRAMRAGWRRPRRRAR